MAVGFEEFKDQYYEDPYFGKTFHCLQSGQRDAYAELMLKDGYLSKGLRSGVPNAL